MGRQGGMGDREPLSRLAGEGLLLPAHVRVAERQRPQRRELRPDDGVVGEHEGVLLSLRLHFLHRPRLHHRRLRALLSPARHAHPLGGADDARLGGRALLLRAVLHRAHGEAVHQVRRHRFPGLALPVSRLSLGLGGGDPPSHHGLRPRDDHVRRPLLEPHPPRDPHERAVPVHEASGVRLEEHVVVAGVGAVRDVGRLRARAQALHCSCA